MTDGRGWRFALEVAFLVALAVVLGVADVASSIIVAIMLAGWVLVALLEWAAWREEPHWGSGSPPRYYVPPTELPPRRPIDPAHEHLYDRGYPAPQREPESPTWIATPEMRRAALGDWPVAPPIEDEEPVEDERRPLEEHDDVAAEAEVAAEPESAPVPVALEEDEQLEEALMQAAIVSLEDAPVAVDEPLAEDAADGAAAVSGNGADPWEVQAYPQEPVLTSARPSKHRIDPLVAPEGRRWPWQRRDGDDGAAATEFPTRPRHGPPPRRGADG
jgi:hypothetical protein